MKKLHRNRILMLILLVIAVLFSACSGENITLSVLPEAYFTPADGVIKPAAITEETRGIWIASVYNIDFPSSPDLSEKELKAELDAIVDDVLSYNMNTVYFQVHPASDAMYRSDIFPVSQFLFTDGKLHFDPLEYMAKICNENGISLYAWVNPLRLSVSVSETEEQARDALPVGSPGKDKELTIFYGDGKLYLNCGVGAVRDLVTEAVKEIATSYDVDGIVFDDYFYPYPVNNSDGTVCIFDDSETYAAASTSVPLEDWRRSNVNELVKQCYSAIKNVDPELRFGVAPFGIWQNDNGTNGGSASSGMEAYHELYCDATAWINGKYIDFISPQLYWRCDSTSAPFEELVIFWDKITEGTGVDLTVSHGIYQYETWDNPAGELNKQVELSRKLLSYRGSVMYGYGAMKNNSSGVTDDVLSAFENDVYYYHSSGYPDGISVSVVDDAKINGMKVTFEGYSDPEKVLSVNGMPITRSHGGYFKCELLLEHGENEFVFACGDTVKTVTVIKNISD